MAKKGNLTCSEALDYDDFKRLLKGLRQDGLYKWELVCAASFCTALRVSDVKSTTWRDILYQNDLTKLEKKTSKVRDIHLGASFRKLLGELYELLGRPDLDSCIIPNDRTGKPMTTQHINKVIKTFIFRYKLPIKKFSTHTFRKTFGRTVWEMMGRTAEALTYLNLIFKHHNLMTTTIYLGIKQEEIQGIYEMIELD